MEQTIGGKKYKNKEGYAMTFKQPRSTFASFKARWIRTSPSLHLATILGKSVQYVPTHAEIHIKLGKHLQIVYTSYIISIASFNISRHITLRAGLLIVVVAIAPS